MHHTDSGLYYLQSRYYDPKIGQFLTHDVVFDTDAGLQGFNLFAYCGNNPISRFDSSGASSEDFDGKPNNIMSDVPMLCGGGSSHGGGAGALSIFKQSLKDAASGLTMATGQKAFTGSEYHHIYSDKNKVYTPQYREITDRYHFSLNQQENIVELENHRGRHTNVYHDFMLETLISLDKYAGGDSTRFLEGISVITEFLTEYTWIPYARKGG